jgi:hypothetical protein
MIGAGPYGPYLFTQKEEREPMNEKSVIIMGGGQSPALPRGRLMFALDATASREPTWAIARELQAKMFREATPIGKLDLRLVFYGGNSCRKSEWVSSGAELARLMAKIACGAGMTQIGRVLDHVLREHEQAPVQAVTFIGDAMEEEIDMLAHKAAKLGSAGVPIFIFQEGRDSNVRKVFRLLALKSGGAYFEFNSDKPWAVEQLSEQLNAVARLAVGDAEALERIGGTATLTDQRG